MTTKTTKLNWEDIKRNYPNAFKYFDGKLNQLTDKEGKHRFYQIDAIYVSCLIKTIFSILKHAIGGKNHAFDIWSVPLNMEMSGEPTLQAIYEADTEFLYRLFRLLEFQLITKDERYISNLTCTYEYVASTLHTAK